MKTVSLIVCLVFLKAAAYSPLVADKIEKTTVLSDDQSHYVVTYHSGRTEIISWIKYNTEYSMRWDRYWKFLKGDHSKDSFNDIDEENKLKLVTEYLAGFGYLDNKEPERASRLDELASSFLKTLDPQDKSDLVLRSLNARGSCDSSGCKTIDAKRVEMLLQNIEQWNSKDIKTAVCSLASEIDNWADSTLTDSKVPDEAKRMYVSRTNYLNKLIKESPTFNKYKTTTCEGVQGNYQIAARLNHADWLIETASKTKAQKSALSPSSTMKTILPECPSERSLPVLATEFEKVQKLPDGRISYLSVNETRPPCSISLTLRKIGRKVVLLDFKNSLFMSTGKTIEVSSKKDLVSKVYGSWYLQVPWVQSILGAADDKKLPGVK